MLSLTPKNFRTQSLALGGVGDLDLQLGDRKLSLAVEALAKGRDKVDILFSLRLVVEDQVGMQVDYVGEFEVKDPSNPDFEVTDAVLSNTFIQVNAPAIAYPFLRAYVAHVSVMSGFNQVLLPPVNFQAIFDKRKKSEEGVTSQIAVR